MRQILGLKQKEFEELVTGAKEVNGASGPEALQGMLNRINLPVAKERALNDIKHGVKSKRDAAIKRFRFLDAFEKHQVKPEDFLMTRVPVLPPRFRPITQQNDMTMVADPNYMYKALMESIEDFNDTKDMPTDMRSEARKDVWDSYKALVGLTDPNQQQLQQKNVKGILSQVFGKGSPKNGFVQRRVLGTNIDVSGLGVVTPNPSLNLNEVGMPEKLAWDLYEPFIVRDLVKKGMPATQAAKAVEKQSPPAEAALRSVVKQRPVLVNRAPTLHKYSIMAFWPVLTKGSTVQVSPTIVKPFGMDFDGDTASFTVPVSNDAVKQSVEKMMPDKHLLSARAGKPTYVPSNEYLQGMYLATKSPKKKPVKTFQTMREAVQAYRKGEIAIDDPIRVVDT
jgi:DNA-directed RNA polymerase subunit beta'